MQFSRGRIVREPVGHKNGYWAGAPGAFYDPVENAWYLTYRLRRPRGVEPDRGGEAFIARSTDLVSWENIWSVNKNEYRSASIERSALHRGDDRFWRYFTSYVSPDDGRWCVAMLRGWEIPRLYSSNAHVLFTAKALQLEGVKDPWIIRHGNVYYMFVSVALQTHDTTEQSHATSDIYNTGQCVSATGLAISTDLDHWDWKGVVFRPNTTGWDRYCRRINSVVPINGNFLAFYDGSAGHEENYEEKTGVAISTDLRRWRTLTPKGPAYISPHGSHSLRYIDTKFSHGDAVVFYESAQPDGSHDLRVLTVDESAFHAELDRLCAGTSVSQAE